MSTHNPPESNNSAPQYDAPAKSQAAKQGDISAAQDVISSNHNLALPLNTTSSTSVPSLTNALPTLDNPNPTPAPHIPPAHTKHSLQSNYSAVTDADHRTFEYLQGKFLYISTTLPILIRITQNYSPSYGTTETPRKLLSVGTSTIPIQANQIASTPLS
jgi:hypothetical protein